MRIQHNIMAMNAYRNYNTNTSALSKNLEKLSSGYKINRAGDDAAGLAISEKMRAQITGLNAASKNVKDGISLVKTAEGAMQEIQDMLNRMDYLATQSANGTYDNDVDRKNLQKEVDALKKEINRIADSANFNGINLLDGSKAGAVVDESSMTDVAVTVVADGKFAEKGQAGEYTYDLSNVTFTGGASATATTVTASIAGTTVTFKLSQTLGTGVTAGIASVSTASATIGGATYKITFANGKLTLKASKAPTTDTGIDWSLKFTTPNNSTANQAEAIAAVPVTVAKADGGIRQYAQAEVNLASLSIKDGTMLKIGNETYTFALGSKSNFKGGKNVVDLTNIKASASAGKIAKAAADKLAQTYGNSNSMFKIGIRADGKIGLTEKEGAFENYDKYDLAGTANASDGNWTGLVKTGTAPVGGGDTGLTLQIGDTSDSYNRLDVVIGDMHTTALGINGVDISNPTGAASAIQTIRGAINSVSSVRGDLGATQNRLEHTANNLSVMAENIQDAESTIRDTDVAEEMMAYTKNNILIQSAQAMLAQANAVPQGVLQLLG